MIRRPSYILIIAESAVSYLSVSAQLFQQVIFVRARHQDWGKISSIRPLLDSRRIAPAAFRGTTRVISGESRAMHSQLIGRGRRKTVRPVYEAGNRVPLRT